MFLPGESHGQRSLVGYSPWRCKELDTTAWLSRIFIFVCTVSLLLCTAWFSKLSRFTTLSCGAQPSLCGGFSCCGAQALGTWASVDAAQGLISCWFSSRRLMDSRTQTQWLWCTGFSCPRHVGSSQTRDQTSFPCIAKRILNHWTSREAPSLYFLKTSSQF